MPAYRKHLKELSNKQFGYFTAKQAASCGFVRRMQTYHCKAGNWEKYFKGVYRFAGCDDSMESDFTKWSMWSRNQNDQPQGIISHSSALALHGLGEYDPSQVHMTVPVRFQKKIPEGLNIHKEELSISAIETRESYMVTRLGQTLKDVKPELATEGRWTQVLDAVRNDDRLTQEEMKTLGILTGSEALKGVTRKQGLDSVTSGVWKMICKRSRFAGVHSRAGFTLVELLVVISIISVLAAMLLPALRSSLQSVRTSACLNNLKNIGIGVIYYADTFDGYFPARGGSNGPQWISAVETVIQSITKWPGQNNGNRPVGIWACPESELTVGWYFGEYGTNPATGTSPGGTGGLDYSNNNWVKLGKVKSPSKAFFCIDSGSPEHPFREGTADAAATLYAYMSYSYMPGGGTPRHNGKSCILFIDGHAGNVNPYDAYEYINGYNRSDRGVGMGMESRYLPWNLSK